MTTIKILGTGCTKCKVLEYNVQQAIQTIGITATVIKVTNIEDIMQYNITATPGLVIDEKLVSYGKVNDSKEIIALLNNNNTPLQATQSGCSCNC